MGFFMSQQVRYNLMPSLRFVALMWLVFFISEYLQFDVGKFGIFPRTFSGLIGIFTAPFIHDNSYHLLSNTFPFMFLSGVLFIFYVKIANRIFWQCFLITGVLVWLFGRPFYHIGASGLIYALAFFLITMGFVKKDFRSLAIAIVVIILYGSFFYGIFPTQMLISWESHLMGAIVGIASALSTSKFLQARN